MDKKELAKAVGEDLITTRLKIGDEPQKSYVDKNEVLQLIGRLADAPVDNRMLIKSPVDNRMIIKSYVEPDDERSKGVSFYQVILSCVKGLPITYLIEASDERDAAKRAISAFDRNSRLKHELLQQVYVSKER